MKKRKKYRSTLSELLSAALYVIIGLILLVVLKRYYSTAVTLIGCALALIGAIKIIRFFTNHDKRAPDVLSLLIGIVALLGAVAVFANIRPVLELGVVLLGGYILLSAVLRFSSVRRLGKDAEQNMTVPVVLTAFEALCGIFSIAAKALLPDAMFQAAGGALVVFGILEFVIILMTSKARKAANKA